MLRAVLPIMPALHIHLACLTRHADLTLPVFNSAGESQTHTHLHTRVWGADLRKDLVHRVVVWQDKNARTTLYKAKDRAQVAGGGKKPWRQKGTGRARAGSIRSPLFRGGGASHGPVFRDWSISLPKAVREAGLRVALSAKLADQRVIVVDAAPSVEKTKALATWIRTLTKQEPLKTVIVVEEPSAELTRASSNLLGTKVLPVAAINVRDIVGAQWLVVTQGAVSKINERLAD